jgi:outer membrane protein OmpA-like peptidoglycan-associated protein
MKYKTFINSIKNYSGMSKRIAFSILTLVLATNVTAQDETDMVENGSFEQIEGKIKKAGSIEVAVGWMSPTKTSADLFARRVKEGFSVPQNPYGNEEAFDGDSYVGITTFSYGDKEARTYISTRLKTPMRKGLKYAVKFYVSLSEGSKYAANNVAANFSKKQYNIPEDKSIIGESHVMHVENPVFNAMFGWDEVCGVYTSTGGEKFLTIGNFSTNGDTKNERMKKPKSFTGQQMVSSYYYIDNISVTLIEDESKCECRSDKEEETSIVYAVSPVNPEGMKDELVAKYSVVYFGYNNADLTESANGHLDNIIMVMKKDPAYKLKLIVNMDSEEALDEKANGVDQKRADAVKTYLVTKGVDGNSISFSLVKDSEPSDKSGTDVGKAKNRNIEFVITK